MEEIKTAISKIKDLPLSERVEEINKIKLLLKEVSPFSDEPVDCVIWVKSEDVQANDYNPNNVAPPEMKLLAKSIESDGYTQPIVVWQKNGHWEVVDGFHRNRICKENSTIFNRVNGYLPITVIKDSQVGKGDRIASTIRHNRARGKHQIDLMAEIVLDLKRRNWSNDKISRELGMDADEVLRLSQITGLAEMFIDEDFSKSWEPLEIDEEDNLIET